MTEENIKKTWRHLLIPFLIGLVIFIISFLYHRLASKRPTPQTISLFACVFGFVFMFFAGMKMYNFKKYLKSQNDK